MPESDQLRALTTKSAAPALRQLTEQLVADPSYRERFNEDPAGMLREVGIPVPEEIQLSQRDRLLLELVSDERVARMYTENRMEELHEYAIDRYGELLDPGGVRSITDVDFDVIAVAEVVAVAVVAVAAIAVAAVVAERPGELINERLRRMETLTDARIRVLEAKIEMLESRL